MSNNDFILQKLAELEAENKAMKEQIATNKVVVYSKAPKVKQRKRTDRKTIWIEGHGRIFKRNFEDFIERKGLIGSGLRIKDMHTLQEGVI